MIPLWCNEYLTVPSIPFVEKGRSREGLDCYGLVWLILLEQFGIHMPSYDGIYRSIHEDEQSISREIEERAKQWRPINTPSQGDVAIFRWKGHPLHCGMMINATEMINIRRESDVCIESIHAAHWRPRLFGIFRYADTD